MLSAAVSYQIIRRDMTASLERVSEEPTVERRSERYLEELKSIKSIEEFIANDRVYRYAMEAFGLDEMIYAKAFMRKVLTEGVDNPDSFANKLTDSRYKEFAEAFNFARYGETALAFERTQQGTVDRFVRMSLEKNAGSQNEGARLALYFERKASSITSAYSLLADPALMKVAQTALGIPPETAALDIDKQAALYTDRFNVEDFKDPAKLEEFLQRFLVMWDAQNTPALASSPAISLFNGGNVGIDTGLLLSLQTLRSGGF